MGEREGRRAPYKIFGLQRTGTNLMAALLERNFHAQSLERWTEWKHGRVERVLGCSEGRQVRYVICIRNPYAWLTACYRYFQKAAGRDPTIPPQFEGNASMSFETFVTGECYEFQNPVDRWNQLNLHWKAALPPQSTMVVRLEDQLHDQIKVLERAESHLNLKRRSNGLTRIEKRIDIIPNAREPLNQSYTVNREYMLEYSAALLEYINQKVDQDLLHELGYALEDRTLAEQEFSGISLTVRPGTDDAKIAGDAACDLYDFAQINRWSTRIEKIVEFGAHLGTTAILFKRHWPACRVLAYETSGENLRLLRINARRISGVTAVESSGDASAAVDFDRALNHFGGEIDVLRVGDGTSALRLVEHACRRGVLNRARWICGKLPDDPDEQRIVIDELSAAFAVTLRTTSGGEHFLARRIRLARVRAESASTVSRPDALTEGTAFDAATRFIEKTGDCPASRFRGRGIIICGGGRHYFPCAWVCINMLRHLGVGLPIELWGLNAGEIDPGMRELVEPLGVRCVDASRVRKRHPIRILDGWELKPYSIIHSTFREVLFLDADNVAVSDPTVLFDSEQYRRHGAIFWPAYGPFQPGDPIWRICRVAYRNESDFESGQMLIDKSRCWRALQLTMHMNENSDFYYDYTQGDKETFHFAWRMLGHEYAMISTPVVKVDGAAWQHDLKGRRIFQHRYEAKWSIEEGNPIIPGFLYEDLCFRWLADLRRLWQKPCG